MKLEDFSKKILNKDIPLFTLKLIIYMLSSKEKSITVEDACSAMYCTTIKLKSEMKKFRPIEDFLKISETLDGFEFEVGNSKFEVFDIKKKKTKKTIEKNLVIKNKADAIQTVFDYWVATMNKTTRTTLDSNRRKDITRALEHFTVEQCQLAILGCSKNLWNMGMKDNNKKLYNSLNLIFRNHDKIEDFILDSQLPSVEEQLNLAPKSTKIEDRLKDNDWLKQRSNMVGDTMGNVRDNVEGLSEDIKDIQLKENNLLIENKISTINNLKNEIDIVGLIEKSEIAFYSLNNADFVLDRINNINKFKDDDIIEGEIIEGGVLENNDDIPYYLKFSQSKED